MRAMARRPDGSEQALVEVKGVDAAYPLVGSVALSDGMELTEAIRRQPGAAVDSILLDRLGLKVGDQLSLGKTLGADPRHHRGRTRQDHGSPDGRPARVRLARHAAQHGPDRTGQPGHAGAMRLKLDGASAETDRGLVNFTQSAKQALPEGGFTIRDRRDPLRRFRARWSGCANS